MAQLMTIPGIDWVVAGTIIAEIGLGMSVFPSAGHLAAWTGALPREQKRAPATANWPAPAPAILTSRPRCATPRSPAPASKRGSFFKAK
jgi:Transposase IS116/IS110/IS902 family